MTSSFRKHQLTFQAGFVPLLVFTVLSSLPTPAPGQESCCDGRWSIGLEIGELPMAGSFKVGVSAGYHVNEYMWFGVAYQIGDSIHRNTSSFNARSADLEGLVSSSESVGQRAYLQARLRPHRWSPFLSVGLVFNDRDTETTVFEPLARDVDGHEATGPLALRVSRPPGLRPALGLGYEWTSSGGVSAFVEWAGWWLRDAPNPDIGITSSDLGDLGPADTEFELAVDRRVRDHFRSSVFNTYHIFQLGVAYRP